MSLAPKMSPEQREGALNWSAQHGYQGLLNDEELDRILMGLEAEIESTKEAMGNPPWTGDTAETAMRHFQALAEYRLLLNLYGLK